MRFHNLAGAPANPGLGQVYFSTLDSVPYVWDGAGWHQLSNLTGGQIVALIVAEGADGPGSDLNADFLHGFTPANLRDRATHTGTQLAATISNFDAQVRTNRLDQLAAPTSALSVGGQRLTNVATPTASTDAVTKAYADNLASGIDFKQEVVAASTENVNVATHVGPIDGVALNAGDRVLLRGQNVVGERRIYTYNGGGGGFTVAPDFTQAQAGAFVYVLNGTLYGGTAHVWNGSGQAWVQFSGVSSLTAGGGLAAGSGNTISVGYDDDGGIIVEPDYIAVDFALVTRKYSTDVPALVAPTFGHGFDTRDVIVQVRQNAAPYAVVECDVELTNPNLVTLRFATAPAAGALRITIHG